MSLALSETLKTGLVSPRPIYKISKMLKREIPVLGINNLNDSYLTCRP